MVDEFGFKDPANDIHVEEPVEDKQLQIQAETLKNFANDIRMTNWTDQGTANAIADRADKLANDIMKGRSR